MTGLAVLLAISGAISSSLAAQEGGVVAEFCQDDRLCIDDTLEIVFESGSSTYEGPVETGVEIQIEVVLDTKSPGIQGYSWGVKHDSAFLTLIPERLTTAGTIIDPESPDTAIRGEHFGTQRAVEGGFIAAMVLSLRERATLPPGRNAVCRAAYRVVTTPECTVIRFVHHQLAVGGGYPVDVVIATTDLDGRVWSRIPRFLRQGLIGTGKCSETCDDLADNDGDGLPDCMDPECIGHAVCSLRELCFDGADNNGNGKVDCEDQDCAACTGGEVCDDGADNDGDGFTDCDDSDCSWRGICIVEVCDDGADNDRDGLTDCDDGDCTAVSGCPQLEVCDDGIDNDGDSLADCDDLDCSESGCETMFNHGEPVEVCDDGIDNDGDGFVDGLDRDCFPDSVVIPGGAAPLPSVFLRGDADGDGRLTVLDAVLLIQIVVRTASPRDDCLEALNPDGDAGISLSDPLYLVRWIFLDGPPPPFPFPACDSSSLWCGSLDRGCL